MPVYNSERFLAQSLDSLLAQDLTDFELIISDNASTDRSGEICREYSIRDPRIRYLHQPRNIGAVANWNYLVYAARGRYFKWCSSNDLCAPQLLRRCVEALEAHADTVLCYGRTALIDDDGQFIEEYPYDVELLEARPSVRFRRACLEMRLNNAQCAVLRLDVLQRTGLERGFPEGDMPLMAELALHGRFRQLPEILLYRRMGRQSATKFMTGQQKAAFRNPVTVDRREYVVWPTFWDNVKSVLRVPLSPAERFASLCCVLRQLLWSRQTAQHEIGQRLGSRDRRLVTSRKSVIALLGAYSSRNFGDTAIQASVIHHLRRRLPQLELVGISHDAVDTLQTHGISGWTLQADEGLPEDPRVELRMALPAIFKRRFRRWRRMWRIARDIDMLVISGSGQLEDFWGGPWGHAYTLLAWALAFRLRRKRVAVLATGLDDLSTPLGTHFIRWMLRLAHYRSFRDAGTLEKLRALGFAGDARVCPDLAFSYPISRVGWSSPATRRPVVVLCPISQRAFRRPASGVYETYLEALREVCLELVAMGCTVRLSNSQVDMDGPLVRQFHADLVARGVDAAHVELKESRCLADYLVTVGAADLVVASRLHALILSVVSGTPVVALSYSRKVSQLMSDIGSASTCIELQDVQAAQIARLARESLDAGQAPREQLRSIVSAHAAALDAEYAAILQMLLNTGMSS